MSKMSELDFLISELELEIFRAFSAADDALHADNPAARIASIRAAFSQLDDAQQHVGDLRDFFSMGGRHVLH